MTDAAAGQAEQTPTGASLEHKDEDVAMDELEEADAKSSAILRRIADVGATVFFEKALTASDASGSGRVVVPKVIAEQYFPRLEVASGIPVSASDLDGRLYTFKWRFWVNNSSRMYLLEGAAELHANYDVSAGDIMVFAQKQDGSLLIAGRPATKADSVRKAPVKRAAPSEKAAAGGGGASGGSRAREPRARAPRATFSPGAGDERAAAGSSRSGKRSRTGAAAAAIAAGQSTLGAGLGGGPRSRELTLSLLDLAAPADGIFRALVAQQAAQPGVAPARSNRWTVTLDLAGELYQAFFDSQEDAVEAFNAAGGDAGQGQGQGADGDAAPRADAAAAAPAGPSDAAAPAQLQVKVQPGPAAALGVAADARTQAAGVQAVAQPEAAAA